MSITRKMLSAAQSAGGWDVNNLAFNGVGYFGKKEDLFRDTTPQDIFFGPNGTDFYMVGSGSDRVNQYSLSVPWEIATATYVRFFAVGAQELTPSGLFFKPDGTKMYIVGVTGDDVNEYNLSTPWNIATASFVRLFSVAAQEINPSGLFFRDTGFQMFVIGTSGDDINAYSLSTAWDISTASFVKNFSVAAQDISPTGLFFRSDGVKMYVAGDFGDDINEYTLSTAWDISTASFVQNFSVGLVEATPRGVSFKPDGTQMYIGGGDKTYWQFTLTTAWDISTAAVAVPTNSFFLAPFEGNPTGMYIRPDGAKMYVLGSGLDDIEEFDLSPAWRVENASFVQTFSIAAQETFPKGLFFKDDGTRMYVIGDVGQDINEYSLSTAWNIGTASFLQSTSIANDTDEPNNIYFRPDGTKAYFIDKNDGAVIGYNLASAWDISTASGPTYPGKYLVTQDSLTRGIYIKQDDGTKMYVVGQLNDRVYEYNLSVAWDITSATFVQFFSVAPQDTAPTGLFFKSDGTKMYVLGDTGNDINEYALSTAWNISTATFTTVFSVSTRDSAPSGLAFKPDGTEMYVLGSTTDDLFQFSLSTAWDISSATFTRSKPGPAGLTSITDGQFSSDGVYYYLLAGSQILRYIMSTPWNISTAVQSFSISPHSATGRNITFKPDGTKMYMTTTSFAVARVLSFTLSTPWDITTASYDAPATDYYWLSDTFDAKGLHFKPDGTKMYTADDVSNLIDEYSMSTPWDVTTASLSTSVNYDGSLEPNPSTIFFRDTDGKKMYLTGTYNLVLWEYDL